MRYTVGDFVRYVMTQGCARALTLRHSQETSQVRTQGAIVHRWLAVAAGDLQMAEAEMPLLSPQDVKKNRANDDNYADRDGPRGKEWHRQRKGARGAIGRPKNRPAGPGFAVGV